MLLSLTRAYTLRYVIKSSFPKRGSVPQGNGDARVGPSWLVASQREWSLWFGFVFLGVACSTSGRAAGCGSLTPQEADSRRRKVRDTRDPGEPEKLSLFWKPRPGYAVGASNGII